MGGVWGLVNNVIIGGVVKIEEAFVEEVGRDDVAQGSKRATTDVGIDGGQPAQETFHSVTLEVVLRTAERAWDEWEVARDGKLTDPVLGAVCEGSDDDVSAVIADKLGGHCLELPRVEDIKEERLNKVVSVVTEGDFCGAELLSLVVEDTAPESATQRAGGLFGLQLLFDDAVGVPGVDDILEAMRFEVLADS